MNKHKKEKQLLFSPQPNTSEDGVVKFSKHMRMRSMPLLPTASGIFGQHSLKKMVNKAQRVEPVAADRDDD